MLVSKNASAAKLYGWQQAAKSKKYVGSCTASSCSAMCPPPAARVQQVLRIKPMLTCTQLALVCPHDDAQHHQCRVLCSSLWPF